MLLDFTRPSKDWRAEAAHIVETILKQYALMKNAVSIRGFSIYPSQPHLLVRIAVVRYIDSLFYQDGTDRWCHNRCHTLIIRELCGIGPYTFHHYLHYRSERIERIVLPRHLKELLKSYVQTIKRQPERQAAELLLGMRRQINTELEESR